MPIPIPNPSESESEYVSRCMHKIGNEYDQNTALGICYDTYKKASASAKTISNLKNIFSTIKQRVKDFAKKGNK